MLKDNRRWTHYIASITTAINALAICFIRESRPSRILKKHLDAEYPGAGLRPADDDIMPSFRDFLSIGLKKPFVLLCTEPILLVVTIMSASVYGFAYLLTEALPDIYAGFGYDRLESATLYLFLALGAVLALLVRTIDVWVASRHEACGRKVVSRHKSTRTIRKTHAIRYLKTSFLASSSPLHFRLLRSGSSHGLYRQMFETSPPPSQFR